MSQPELAQTQLEIARLQLEQERHKLAHLQKRQRVADDRSRGAVAVGGAAAGMATRSLKWLGKTLVAWAVMFGGFVYEGFKDATDPTWDFLYRIGFAAGQISGAAIGWMLLIAMAAALLPWRSKPDRGIPLKAYLAWTVLGFILVVAFIWLLSRA